MKKEIQNCLSWLVNTVSQTIVYGDCWDDKLKVEEVKDAYKKFYDTVKKHIDFDNLTIDEAKELRFKKWDDDSDLYLFPLWLVPIIPEELPVYFIDSDEAIPYNKLLDNDVRFGCVAYGLKIKEEKEC